MMRDLLWRKKGTVLVALLLFKIVQLIFVPLYLFEYRMFEAFLFEFAVILAVTAVFVLNEKLSLKRSIMFGWIFGMLSVVADVLILLATIFLITSADYSGAARDPAPFIAEGIMLCLHIITLRVLTGPIMGLIPGAIAGLMGQLINRRAS